MTWMDDEWEVVNPAARTDRAADEWEPVVGPPPAAAGAAARPLDDEWEPVAAPEQSGGQARGAPATLRPEGEISGISTPGPGVRSGVVGDSGGSVLAEEAENRPDRADLPDQAGAPAGEIEAPGAAERPDFAPGASTGKPAGDRFGSSLRARTPDDVGRSVEAEARRTWEGQSRARQEFWRATKGTLAEKVGRKLVDGLDFLLGAGGGGIGGTGIGKEFVAESGLGKALERREEGRLLLQKALDMGLADYQNPAGRFVGEVAKFVAGGDLAVAQSMPAMLAFPVLAATRGALDGRQVAPAELAEEVVKGLVFDKIPLPKALHKQAGGIVKLLAKSFGRVGIRTLEMLGVRSGFAVAQGQELPTAADAAESAAFMLALEVPQIAFNVAVGKVTSDLKKTGIPEGKSSEIANAYVMGTISKRDLAKTKVMVPHLEKMGLDRDLALKILESGGKGRMNTMWAAVEDELTGLAQKGGFDQVRAQAIAKQAVKTYQEQIGGLPEMMQLLRTKDARDEFVRRAQAWNNRRAGGGAPAGESGAGEPGARGLPMAGAAPDAGGPDITVDATWGVDVSRWLGRHVGRPGRAKGAAVAGPGVPPAVPETFESTPAGRQAAREHLLGLLTGYGLTREQAGRIAARAEPAPGWRPEDLANLPGRDLDGLLRGEAEKMAARNAAPGAPPAPPAPPPVGAPPAPPPPVPQAPKARIDVGGGAQRFDVESPRDPKRVARGRWGWVYLDDPALQAGRAARAAMSEGVQERDRTRAASAKAALERLQRFSARRLGESITADVGAPVVGADGRILAGYGRLGTYDDVWRLPDGDARKADLMQFLRQGARLTGVEPDWSRRPVLVRVADEFSGTDPEDFARRSNENVIQGFSESENALRDAEMIERRGLIQALNPDESGNLLAASNRAFYNAFIEATGAAAELSNADGSPAPAAERRMQMAILAAVLKEHRDAVDIVALMLERADDIGAVRLVKGISAAAPGLLKFKGGKYDVTPDIALAVAKFKALKEDLRSGYFKTVDDALSQRFLLDDTPDAARAILKLLATARSTEQIKGVLEAFAEAAAQIDVGTPDMFGDAIPESTKLDLLNRSLKKWEDEYVARKAEQKSREVGQGAAAGDGGAGLGPDAQPGGAGAVSPGGGAGVQGAAGAPAAVDAAAAEDQAILDEALKNLEDVLGGVEPGAAPAAVAESGELYGEGAVEGPSAFRVRLERLAGSKAGGARADVRQLADRELQDKAAALLQAVKSGRIDEVEAERRLAEASARRDRVIAADERKRQAQIDRGRQQDMFEAPAAAREMLFERSEVEQFAREQGVPDEKIFRLSNDVVQLGLPGLDEPYQGSGTAGDAGGVPGGRGGQARVRAAEARAEIEREKESMRRALMNLRDPEEVQRALDAHGGRISTLVHALINRDIPAFRVEGKRVRSPRDFAALALTCRSSMFEVMKIAIVDNETKRVIYSNVLTVGLRDASLIDTQLVLHAVDAAMRKSGLPKSRLLIYAAHNHPSGDPTPSADDINIYRKIEQAAAETATMVGDLISTDGKSFYSHKGQKRIQFPFEELLPEQVMAPEDVQPIRDPGNLNILADSLRQGNPNAVYAIHVNTKNRVREIVRHDATTFGVEGIRQQIIMDSARIHSSGVMLVLPARQGWEHLPDMLQNVLREQRVGLLDVNTPEIMSWRENGLYNFKESAGEYMVREGADPVIMDAGARLVAAFARKEKLEPTAELARKLLARYGGKFTGLEAAVAAEARAMIGTDELKLWADMRRGNLDEKGEQGNQERPEEVSKAAAGDRGGRTDIRIAGQGSLPTPPEIVPAGRFDVDEDQRLGINLALNRFVGDKPGKGFLLGDGTGVGKTSQMLVIGHEYLERNPGARVLIIVPNVQIIQGSYLDDAERLGIDLARFDIGTYSSLRGDRGPSMVLRGVSRESLGEREAIEGDIYDLIMADEAHNLKNPGSQQTIKIMSLLRLAQHTLFATATPMDTPTGAAYFLGEITGIERRRMARMLGFDIHQVKKPNGEIVEQVTLLPHASWASVKKNLANLRDVAVRQGAIVRREYPFKGRFESLDVELDPETQAIHTKIEAYYDAIISKIKPGRFRAMMKANKTHALSNWLESQKAPAIFERIKQSLAEGRRVVVSCEYVEPSDRLRRPEERNKFKEMQAQLWDIVFQGHQPQIPGTISELARMLDEAGIGYARVYGRGPKGPEVARFQSGEFKVMLMTPRSGGAGINADDQVGGAPRDLIRVSENFAGDVSQQTEGRINRRNTVDPEAQRVIDAYVRGAFSDERRREVNKRKQEILRRIQEGEDIDLAGFDPEKGKLEGGVEMAPAREPVLDEAAFGDENLSEPDVLEDPAADMGLAWPGGPLGEPKVQGSTPQPRPADDPNFTLLPIEMPELVQVARALTGGQYPSVVRKMSKALGKFYPGSGRIELLARLFQPLTKQEMDRIRQAADARAAAAAGPGKSVDRLADEYYEAMLDEEYRAALKRNPLQASKVLAHEIGHVVDWLPQHMIDGRGNILGHIAAFVHYEIRQLAMLPTGQGNLLTDQDRQEIRKEARRLAKGDSAAEKRIYADLVRAERQRRGIFTREEIIEELEPVVSWWRGTGDQMEPYYKKPEEMYAETLSVLLNNPAALEARAPKFFALFRNWLENRPECKRLYEAVQNAINSGQIYKDRVELMYQEMEESDIEASKWAEMRDTQTIREFKDKLRTELDRRFGPHQQRIARVGDDQVRRAALGALSDSLYRGTRGELILDRVQNEVLPRLAAGNFRWRNLGEYLLHARIAFGDRRDLANPWGMTPKSSVERLAEMQRDYGPERFGALQEAALWLRNIYESEVLAPAREADIFGETQDILEERLFYATFAVMRDMPADRVRAALEDTLGGQVTSHIYKQWGTLKPVKNPATATLQKMLAISSMIYRENAKWQCVQTLLESEFANEWRPADMEYSSGRPRIKEVETAHVSTLKILHSGRLHGFYGPRSLVESFNYDTPAALLAIARVWTGPLKTIFTAANPAYWPVGFFRDVQAFNYRMPGMARRVQNWMPGGVFPRYAGRAFAAARSTIRGTPDAIGQDALRRGVVISRAAGYMGQYKDDEFDRMVKRRGLRAVMEEDRGRFALLRDAWGAWIERGQILERTVKIAGMLYMDEQFPDMPEELKRLIVRAFAGSPDFLEAGRLSAALDASIFLFYNPAKEGARTAIQAYTGLPGEPGRPGEMAWQNIRWVLLPRLMLQALAAGGAYALGKWLGEEKSEWSQMYQDGPAAAERMSSTCIPLGWHDKSKREVVYLRLPIEPSQRPLVALLDAVISKLSGSDLADLQTALGISQRELPGFNPVSELALQWGAFGSGQNPSDSFRGRPILSEREQTARAVDSGPALRAMGRHTWNKVLGSSVGYMQEPPRPDESPLTIPKRILRLPVVGQMVGRWIRISNAGARERMTQTTQTVAGRQAMIKMEVDAALVEAARTGKLPDDVLGKISAGKALVDQFKDQRLTEDLELQRYYWTYYRSAVENAMLGQLPLEIQTLKRQPTRAAGQALLQNLLGQ